jgi:hypothetical protein
MGDGEKVNAWLRRSDAVSQERSAPKTPRRSQTVKGYAQAFGSKSMYFFSNCATVPRMVGTMLLKPI